MKKILLVLAALLSLVAPACAQGTLTMAANIQQDANGQPLAGALLFIYVVNTVATPQIAYQDINLTIPLPWPVMADQNGRLPFFYLASGSVHARLTDASGNVQFDYPNLLVIGGASGGGGGGGQVVDPTTVATTGDIKARLTNETLAGWVVLNGTTIGSATSGATGFASATAQNLFIYLWTNCPNAHCPVTPGGRGSTAIADFNANKQLQLMDMRDSALVGRDCMGSACLGGILLSNISSGGTDTADTPGAFGGVANKTLTLLNLPNLSLPVSIPAGQGSHTHAAPAGGGAFVQGYTGTDFSGSTATAGGAPNVAQISGVTQAAVLPGMSGTASLAGSSTPVPTISPFKLVTFYIKL